MITRKPSRTRLISGAGPFDGQRGFADDQHVECGKISRGLDRCWSASSVKCKPQHRPSWFVSPFGSKIAIFSSDKWRGRRRQDIERQRYPLVFRRRSAPRRRGSLNFKRAPQFIFAGRQRRAGIRCAMATRSCSPARHADFSAIHVAVRQVQRPLEIARHGAARIVDENDLLLDGFAGIRNCDPCW